MEYSAMQQNANMKTTNEEDKKKKKKKQADIDAIKRRLHGKSSY